MDDVYYRSVSCRYVIEWTTKITKESEQMKQEKIIVDLVLSGSYQKINDDG